MPAPKGARRQHRFTISEDMGAVWDWFKAVPPRAASGEIEFLLRLGVLAAGSVRSSGAGQAGRVVDRERPSASSPSTLTAAGRPAGVSDAVPEAEPAGGGADAAGWNFTEGAFEASRG